MTNIPVKCKKVMFRRNLSSETNLEIISTAKTDHYLVLIVILLLVLASFTKIKTGYQGFENPL